MLNSVSVDALNQSLAKEDWPRIDRVSGAGTSIKLALYIRNDLSYLAGHFPEQPVVPGVIQIHWVGQLARQFFDCRGFAELKKIKFSHVILPESSLELNLEYNSESGTCGFEYRDLKQSYSSGVLGFSSASFVE